MNCHLRRQRLVAIKVSDPAQAGDGEVVARFRQEQLLAVRLAHPNLVALYDLVISDDGAYFVMELARGVDLRRHVRAGSACDVARLYAACVQILHALECLETAGIVHRDLKPSNIILVPDGDGEIVKLVDFGIGKVIHRGDIQQDLTQEGVMVGTPRYMAPEQFDGAASTASDLYALGTIVYQALTGHLPFRGSTLAEFMVAKLTHPIPRMREIAPACDAPEHLEALVLGLLARSPQDRPPLDVVFSQLAQIEEEVFGTPHSLRRGSLSGSTPSLPPSASGAHLQVPYTAAGPASMPPSGIMGVTPRPMATTNRPPPAGGRGLAAAVMVLLGMALVGFGGIAWWAKARADAKRASAVASASASAPQPAASAAPETKPPFVLTIESSPPGATVTEDDRAIGETPVQIPIDRASVASGQRTFAVKRDGFLVSTVQQGPSDENVRSVVTLAPDPNAHVKSHAGASKQGGGASTAGKQHEQPAQSNTGSLDIRMNR